MRTSPIRSALALLLGAALCGPAISADLNRAPAAVAVAPAPPALVPGCDDPRVLAKVQAQFEYGAPRVLGLPLAVAQFSGLIERAYLPKGGHRKVERRYCQGEALVAGGGWSDSKGGTPFTTVYYVIEHPLGFASIGWNAEGCFLGYDRWKVYGANCESLRRF